MKIKRSDLRKFLAEALTEAEALTGDPAIDDADWDQITRDAEATERRHDVIATWVVKDWKLNITSSGHGLANQTERSQYAAFVPQTDSVVITPSGNIKINDQEGVPVDVVEQLIILWRKTFPGAK
jgi:hypothetical protein